MSLHNVKRHVGMSCGTDASCALEANYEGTATNQCSLKELELEELPRTSVPSSICHAAKYNWLLGAGRIEKE